MTRTPTAEPDSVLIYRLDLPPELAEVLTREAQANERTMPGQIRFALRQWLSLRGAD